MKILLSFIWQHMRRRPALGGTFVALSLLTAALWVVEPLYSSYAVDVLMGMQEGKPTNLWLLGGVWALIYLSICGVQGFHKYCEWKFNHLMELDLLENAYVHGLKLPISFHNTQKTGEVIKTIQDGASELSWTLSRNLVEMSMSLSAAVVFMILSFHIEWRLALVMVGVLTVYICIMLVGTLKTAKQQDIVNQLWVKPTGRAFDAAMNIFSVKSAGSEGREQLLLHNLYQNALVKQLRINKVWAVLEGLHFFMLARILLVIVGVLLLVRKEITLGEMYYFQFSFFRVLTPFEMLSGILPQWNKSLGKLKMLGELMKNQVELGMQTTGKRLSNLRGEVEFRDVCFTYNEQAAKHAPHGEAPQHKPPRAETDDRLEELRDEPTPATHSPVSDLPQTNDLSKDWKATIEHLNLVIRPGEHLAFVGHSGAGKSTIAMLLNRFYDVTCGSLSVDGNDIRDLDVGWWRGQIGLVLQDNLMFNDTVLNNIRYARPDATQAEVEDAAKRASIHEFIAGMPKGYETEVGERGVKLSGGERQRIAIARAILKKPSIVILDEATSALDSLTEKHVQEGIRELIAGRTSVIIAHRLSTVRSVDRIAVLDHGKLLACAPHDELMTICPPYREMVELQQGGVLAE